MEDAIKALLNHGILGVLLVLSGFVIYKLYGALQEEQKARLNDAKAYTERMLTMVNEVHKTVGQLSTMVEAIEHAERRSNYE